MKNFVNRHLQDLKPYTPGEQVNDVIKLNTNENPYPPSERVLETLRKCIENTTALRRYPNPSGEPLRSNIAQRFHVESSDVIVTNGSDEALSLILRATIWPDSSAVMPEISYSLYPTLVNAVGSTLVKAPMLNDFYVNLEALESSNAKVVLLPNPNAQIGEFISIERLDKVIKASDKLWVIDEAYNDFVDSEHASATALLPELNNLIVVRTFSKTHSLAGLRIGYMISKNQTLMKTLAVLKDSYNEDYLAIEAGNAALLDEYYYSETTEKIQAQRARLNKELQAMEFETIESQGNFVLAKPPKKRSAEEIYLSLKEKKVLVRHFKSAVLENYIRISVGSVEEISSLLNDLKNILDS